MTIFLDHGVL